MTAMFQADPIPQHVPPELVRAFTWETLSGAGHHAIQAAADAALQLPDIFYAPGGRFGMNTWMLTSDALIREVFQDGVTFVNRDAAGVSRLIGEDWPLLPLEVDGADHLKWRKLLNPLFSPAKMSTLEVNIEALAVDLVDDLKDRGGCEFIEAFARVFPVQIFLRMFGLPLEETNQFLAWERQMMNTQDVEGMAASVRAVAGYLRAVIAARRAAPVDDLISYVVTAQVEGRLVTDDEAIGLCFLLYLAGLDTVINMLGYMFRFLAEHPDRQQELRDNPARIPAAVEEMLRAFPIIVSARRVTRDIDFHGVTMKEGDVITLGTVFSGRDARAFPDPDTVDFDRDKVDHITFAGGAHRCIGSHLARRELKVAIETWLARIPVFRIAEERSSTTRAGGGGLAVETLPLAW